MVTDGVFSDIDADGDEDLLLVGEWMEIKVLENKKGIFIDNSKSFGINEETRAILPLSTTTPVSSKPIFSILG